MKRHKKKELLDILSSLEELNRVIGRKFDSALPVSVELLGDCQEAAIALGSVLETFGGKGEEPVRILEAYCEKVYRMSLASQDAGQGRKLVKESGKLLVKAKNAVRYGLPEDRKEVVFLPYKASMWDSLESVWREVKEEEGVDAYVVPIPYFDRNPDRTFGQMHDEGGLYPPDVPVTSWRQYHIPERRPDVIYIHNPYDEYNFVTSVHPDFYASNLKEYTDMLVYIPYFVAVNDRVERHFCLAPGVLYADKVVVQSEKIRRIYIEELQKFERDNNCRGRFGNIGEKITVRESPKYIKAKAAKREDYPLPEEWEKLIRREDGSRRKLIFYNTTIAAMLLHREAMLGKIERVLRFFKETEDAVLLWRPHPLLKSTLRSMHPELLQRYLEMEENYKKEGWGIYDESPELYRAIVWSDAYYGDSSSVVELYKQVKKPVMIQNVEV